MGFDKVIKLWQNKTKSGHGRWQEGTQGNSYWDAALIGHNNADLQCNVGIPRSHRNTWDRRALLPLGFAAQLQEGQLRSLQFALAFIHSAPENPQGGRQGSVL